MLCSCTVRSSGLMITCCLTPSCWWKSSYLSVLPVFHNPPAHPSLVSFPWALISFSCELFWATATTPLSFLALGDAGGWRAPGHENIFLQGVVRRCQSDKKRRGWDRMEKDVSISKPEEPTAGFHEKGVGSKRAGFCVLAAKLPLHWEARLAQG